MLFRSWQPAALAAAALVVLVRWRRLRKRRQRSARLAATFPDTVDLLVVLIRSGLTPAHAVDLLADRAPSPWRGAFRAVHTRRTCGAGFVDALDALADTAEPHGRLLVEALSASERFGQPITPALDRLVTEGRAARRRFCDEQSRRLPISLSIPLVCCTLPAFGLLTVAPLIIGALTSLHPQGAAP